MEHIKIDKNIPIPPKYKYPFNDMKVGDSFLCKLKKNEKRYRVDAAIRYARKTSKFKFTTHKVLDGIRIWRIK